MPGGPGGHGRAGRVLVVTRAEDLADELGRIAAAAGTVLEVSPDFEAARRRYGDAALVLVGDDVSVAVALAGFPRRQAVLLVGRDLDDAGVWQRAVEIGAEEVVFLPESERYLASRMADVGEGVPGRGVRISVVGGRGGAGASTLAAALAVTGARAGVPTLLVDGDPLGGGIDLVLGDEAGSGMRWPALAQTRGRLSAQALREELPRTDTSGASELAVLSWDRGDLLTVPREAMRAVLDAGGRAHDLVVVDLPRQRNEAVDEALAASTLTLVLVPAEVRAVAAATRVLSGVRAVAPVIEVVVRGPSASGLPAAAIAAALDLPLAGEIGSERGLPEMLDRGQAPPRRRGPLAGFCADLVADIVLARRHGSGLVA